jgi:haloacetate dehalogenase
MFEGFESRSVNVNGIEIACVIKGHPESNQPAVLLLHGFPQTKAMWSRIAPILAQHFTVVCADLRGYGDSAHPPCLIDASNYSFREMAADQVGLMRALGYEQFHLIGHDRGARTAHRLALDHPQAVKSLTLMDIVPTTELFLNLTRQVAGAYWHWFFLSQPAPFPEKLIGADPDYFYETCLLGWGGAKLSDFNADQLADYRRCWQKPSMIAGSCGDYRAAASIDLANDQADISSTVNCPSLVFYGEHGVMNKLYDIPAQWQSRLSSLQSASLPGGHFFPDMRPAETAKILLDFISQPLLSIQ